MAIQYTVPIKSYDNVDWRANIYSDSFDGLITTLKGNGEAMILEYQGETDDHFGVFIKSTLTLNVLYENNIDVNQLQNSADREYRIEIQRNNVLYWVGYMISEGIEQPMRSDAYTLSLTAICGLSMLEDMDYSHNNLQGTVPNVNTRCPMNYIRQILFAEANLDVPIPLKWTNNLRNLVFAGQDVFIGDVRWSPRGEGFTDFNGEVKKCNYILEGMLKSMQCRIYLTNGRWHIRRIPDYFQGLFQSRQVSGLGVISAPVATENIAKKIGDGGYPFILENDLLTTIPGIKSCKTTYDSEKRENIIPNGDQDLISIGSQLYWGFFGDPLGTSALTEISLDGREGSSTELTNTSGETQYYTTISEGSELLTNGLPIDTKNLVKVMNFSFIFSPKNGFPIGSTGIQAAEMVAAGGGYANGSFVNVPTLDLIGDGDGASLNVVIQSGSVASFEINNHGSGYSVGDVFSIPDSTGGGDGDGFRARVTELDGVIDFSTNPLQLQIVMNIGPNQYFLDDFGIWNTNVNTVISPSVEGLRVGDVARIALDKFRGVILPEADFDPKSGDTCDIKIIFLVKNGQRYIVDNISITIEDSNDVYINNAINSKNTKEESHNLNISSSFGGYMVSNFMSNWDRSDLECEFVDGDKYQGTLTGLNSDAVMRCKYTSSKIFNGNINVRDRNWSFDEIYTIETLADRRFMPLNAKYNIEKCEVNLVAIETRNDDISRSERHFGSNNKQLSN